MKDDWFDRRLLMVNQPLLTINTGSPHLMVTLYRLYTSETRLLGAQAEQIGSPGCRYRLEDFRGDTLYEQRVELPDHPATLRCETVRVWRT